jgi:uncharacterized protein DUF6247
MTSAAAFPDPEHRDGADRSDDALEPAATWAGDEIAARRYGSPAQIRAALLPEQLDQFDSAFDSALSAARRTLRLDQLREVLKMWRRQALLTERDPEGHRQFVAAAVQVQRTGRPRPGSVAWSDLKADVDR